jgi:ERCC4-type nuclease
MPGSNFTFDLNNVRVRCPRKQPQAPGLEGGARTGLVVCPFTVVRDSREQLPYEFTGMVGTAGEPLVVPTVVKGLPSGDYSIDGMEDQVAIERKSLDDLYGSVTWGRERFEREIFRLNAMVSADRMRFAAVVIEASWPEIMAPLEYRPGWINQTEPRSVEGTIVAWSIRFPRVHWWACGDRRGAECRTFSILRKFWEEIKEQRT